MRALVQMLKREVERRAGSPQGNQTQAFQQTRDLGSKAARRNALIDGCSVLRPLPAVSDRMRRVRRSNTFPEQAVRRIIRSLGASYRICPLNLPGRPDIANRSHRWAVFVHGCFWHGHEGCRLATTPKRNVGFWAAKIAANRRRDADKTRALRSLGFRVLVVWQCELRKHSLLEQRLKRFL